MKIPHLATLALLLGACSSSTGGPAADAGADGRRPAAALRFTDLTLARLPADSDFGQDSALGDADGDGDLDIFVPVLKGPNRLLINDGRGRFTAAPAGTLPADSDASVHAVFADLDGDGDLDLALANEGVNRVYINEGPARPGRFRRTTLPGTAAASESVAAGDVDGDGDLDLAFANLGLGSGGEQNQLLLNDGKGRFTEATATNLPRIVDPTYQVRLFDADKDGDLDLFAANNGAQNRLLLNDGKGRFSPAPAGALPADKDVNTAAATGDVDGDGDLDLVTVSFRDTPNRLLLNDGKGRFASAPAGALPADAGQGGYDADLGDVDGDGDLDLVIANIRRPTRLYLNDGRGRFSPAPAAAFPDDAPFSTYDVDLGDLDGDGDLDLFLTNSTDQPDRLYVNGAPPPAAPALRYILPNHGPVAGGTRVTLAGVGLRQVTAARAGSRPLTDLKVAAGGTLTAVTPRGSAGPVNIVLVTAGRTRVAPGAFRYDAPVAGALLRDARNPLPATAGVFSDVVAGDIDGDGRRDLVLISEKGPHRVLRYDPTGGRFVDETSRRLPSANDATTNTGQGAALVDVDRDGDIDLVVANDGFSPKKGVPGKQNRLYLNDGKGVLRDATGVRMPADKDHSNGVAAADFDGDGYPDLAFASGGRNLVYLNRGKGRPGVFVAQAAGKLPSAARFSRTVAAADLDGDKDVDLVFGNKGAGPTLWVNDGKGGFTDATAARLPAVSGAKQDDTVAIVAVDVDGDKDLDLVLARSFTNASRLYLNDGKGRFTQATGFPKGGAAALLYGATAVAAGDLTGDGKVDLLFAFWTMAPTLRLLAGDGKGGFTVRTGGVSAATAPYTGIALLDYDKDGDLDAAVSSGTKSRLFENTRR